MPSEKFYAYFHAMSSTILKIFVVKSLSLLVDLHYSFIYPIIRRISQVELPGSQQFESRRLIELESGEKITIERITNSEVPRVEKVQ